MIDATPYFPPLSDLLGDSWQFELSDSGAAGVFGSETRGSFSTLIYAATGLASLEVFLRSSQIAALSVAVSK